MCFRPPDELQVLWCQFVSAAVSAFIVADEMPELSDGEEEDCEDEEQWQWMEEDAQTVTCLFCDR